MENCVAEPEEPPVSTAEPIDISPQHRGLVSPVPCLFSQRVNTASWMLDCGHRVYMPVLVWVVCLFFFAKSVASIKLGGGGSLTEYNKKQVMILFFSPPLLLCSLDEKIKIPFSAQV